MVGTVERQNSIKWINKTKRMTMMNGHFFFAIGLIIVAFSLCFWFRKEK